MWRGLYVKNMPAVPQCDEAIDFAVENTILTTLPDLAI
jgi:hypothetical protein